MPAIAAGWKLVRRGEVFAARWTLAGRTVQVSLGTADESEARRRAPEIVRRESESRGQSRTQAAAVLTVAQLSNAFTSSLEASHSEKYVARAVTDMAHYIEPAFTLPDQITPEAWERLKTKLHSTPTLRRKAGLSWGSIFNLTNTLRAFLRYCVAQGAISSAPEIAGPSQKQIRQDRAERRAMTVDERDRFLAQLVKMGEVRACRIYVALFWTGLRKGELEAMTPRWIGKDELRIPAVDDKAGRATTIPLHPKARAAIRAQLADADVIDLDQPIFGSFSFHQATDRDHPAGGVFERAVKLAGVDPHALTPHHVTRHTGATIAGSMPDASIAGLKALFRWRSGDVADRYIHANLEAARAIVRAM